MLKLMLPLLLLLPGLLYADTSTLPTPAPTMAPATIEPPDIEARGYLLIDADSGAVLAEKNADERAAPASLTKLMTAYVVFSELQKGQIKLSDRVHISEKAWRTGGSRMFVDVNTDVAVEELLQGMIVQSGNDASVALAEFTAGSEDAFAQLMNRHAARLGMNNSQFQNATGLPADNHYSTPRDLALLARAIIREFPQYFHWYSQKEFTYNNITQPNRNRLLWQDTSVDGMKTGYTEAAGYCLVSTAKREGMRIISVVMGTANENKRIQESGKLINWGFRFYETHHVYQAEVPLKTLRVWKGEQTEVNIGLTDPISVTIPRGQYEKLAANMTTEDPLVAPIELGQPVGSVRIQLGETVLTEQPVVALTAVPEGGFFSRMLDSLLMLF